MISKEKWKQYGLPNMEVKGIVIHNTNNQKASAADLEKWMIENNTSQGTHFIVDHNEVRQVMPLDWSVWNTGGGMDFGNLHCISLEICSNPNNSLYLQGQPQAARPQTPPPHIPSLCLPIAVVMPGGNTTPRAPRCRSYSGGGDDAGFSESI